MEETKTVETLKEYWSIVNKDGSIDKLYNLCMRWDDEKEYEDFGEYEEVIKKVFEKLGATVKQCTKRPFGFIGLFNKKQFKLSLMKKSNHIVPTLKWVS